MNAFERFFKTLGHAVAWPFAHGTQVVKTIETVMVDEPIVKDGLVGLVKHIQTVTEDSAVAIASPPTRGAWIETLLLCLVDIVLRFLQVLDCGI